MTPRCASLPDGRLHFSHGPIDLVLQADGPLDAVNAAHGRAWQRFETVLAELVAELPMLQQPVGDTPCPLNGAVARRMWAACHPYRAAYITPMAAVAGSVAEEIIACYASPEIVRAAVNNGGDIALFLSANASYKVGLCTDIDSATDAAMHGALQADGAVLIDECMPVRGIATSGWRGRSFSLGIADSVTVLAASAAQADAAATVIANAVNIEDARIVRTPACELKDNSDLGELRVTVDVPRLEPALVRAALDAGLQQARCLQDTGLIHDAVLVCQGRFARVSAATRTGRVSSAANPRYQMLRAPSMNTFSAVSYSDSIPHRP